MTRMPGNNTSLRKKHPPVGHVARLARPRSHSYAGDVPSERPLLPRTGSSVMGTVRDLGHVHVVSRQPRTLPAETEADGETVTESNPSLCAPAPVTA
jgi:hypothetical protein